MVAPSFTFAWLGLTAFLVAAQVLVCESEEGPGMDQSLLTAILGLATGTYCDDLFPMLQLVLFCLIQIPGLIILWSLLSPLLETSVTGAVIAGVAILAFGAFLTGFL